MFTAFSILLLAFVYRLRGGGFIQFGSDTPGRIIWGTSLAFAYVAMCFPAVNYWYAVSLIVLGYVSASFPHSAYQNIGRWATPQSDWEGFFLPTPTNAEWTGMSTVLRALYDMAGMAGVGLFSALTVFLPYALVSFLINVCAHFYANPTPSVSVANLAMVNWGYIHIAIGIVVNTILQPFSYLIGWCVPFSIGKSLTAKSTEWGEFFTGASWGIAMWAFLS